MNAWCHYQSGTPSHKANGHRDLDQIHLHECITEYYITYRGGHYSLSYAVYYNENEFYPLASVAWTQWVCCLLAQASL